MLKRIMIFLASILLLLNSALVNASIGGWTLSNPTAVGASILYDGTKGSLTSSVLISPNATQVAKVLRGGVAGIALSFAVEQLLGAVDWVLDPANNRVIYNDKPEQFQGLPAFYYVYTVGLDSNDIKNETFKNAYASRPSAELCENVWLIFPHWKPFGVKYDSTKGSYGACVINTIDVDVSINSVVNPAYDSNVQLKTLSLITAAQQVIENAESDNLDAQFAVLAAATNILSEAEQDDAKAKPIADELENNSKCPSGIVRNGSCWICDKSLFMSYTRATRDAKTATRGKSCKNITDTTIKASNAVLFRNLINARVQENACWSPPDQNHATALVDAQNALSLCEN